MNYKNEDLFKPFTLGSGIELKNRILMAPMTHFSSNEDGSISDKELPYYSERSNGVGAVITACAYVTTSGKGFVNAMGIDNDSFIPGLKKLADTIKGKGAKAILQIFHAGRMAVPELLSDNQTISASAVAPERPGTEPMVPREMTEEEIVNTIEAFGQATRRAIEAGFDGVEIHGANTYLIQQFFSPHSNRRTDKWGGTVEKRMAFPLAVVESVKKAVNEYAKNPFIIGYRLSPEEKEEPGITIDDTLLLVDALSEENLDYIHVSVGNFWAGSIRNEEDVKSRVVMIKERVGNKVPVIGVGGLHTPEEVKKAFDTGVDLIALGRELVMEPKWIEKVSEGKEEDIRTTLSKNDREALAIPESMLNVIVSIPGWFPIV